VQFSGGHAYADAYADTDADTDIGRERKGNCEEV
jgi:hypothetical protein